MSNVTNNLLKNFLKEQSNIYLDTIKYYSNSKTLDLTLLPSKVIDKDNLDEIQSYIKNNLPFISRVNINTVYKNYPQDIENLVLNYWNNILFEVKKNSPSMIGWFNNCKKT